MYSELKRRITEALLVDDRVKEVGDFALPHTRGEVLCTSRVGSTEGAFVAERRVRV